MSIMITDPALLAQLNAAKGRHRKSGARMDVSCGTFIQEGQAKCRPE